MWDAKSNKLHSQVKIEDEMKIEDKESIDISRMTRSQRQHIKDDIFEETRKRAVQKRGG